jgi:hypothetical protein
MSDEKTLAIMKGVGFGVRDTSRAMLWFTACTSEASASLQCIPAEQAVKLLENHGIANVRDLEGKPCWIKYDNGLIKFVDFARI